MKPTVDIKTLIKDVRVALNNNSKDEELIQWDDDNTLELDELILSKVEESVRTILTEAPPHLLGEGDPMRTHEAINWFSGERGKGGGAMLLPQDFIRLVSFQMSDWERAVTTPIGEQDPLYARQKSKCVGIKGNPRNPIVALVMNPAGLMLEFYSCEGGNDVTIKSCRYIKLPKIDEEDRITIPEKLYHAVVYNIAALVGISLGINTETFIQLSKTYLR
jgi:hypothetical protein